MGQKLYRGIITIIAVCALLGLIVVILVVRRAVKPVEGWSVAREKHMHYSEKIELVHSWFWVDELRVSQVLINILGNAIKYTNEGGHIRFEAIEQMTEGDNTSEIYFAVTDDGIGISPEDQQLVFQSFEQAKHQDGVYRQGTGLGLVISINSRHMSWVSAILFTRSTL